MRPDQHPPIRVAALGNSTARIGYWTGDIRGKLPHIRDVVRVNTRPLAIDQLTARLGADTEVDWYVTGVYRDAEEVLRRWFRDTGQESVTWLRSLDFDIPVLVDRPERVGADRLAAALAVGRLKHENSAAIVIDAGTAITVDAVDPDGSFLGGAILPGIRMAARALESMTDMLPLVHVDMKNLPPAIGKNTHQAIRSGISWGTIGAVSRLVQEISWQWSADTPIEVFTTGGAGKMFINRLDRPATYLPNLVLSGIAVAVCREATVPPELDPEDV